MVARANMLSPNGVAIDPGSWARWSTAGRGSGPYSGHWCPTRRASLPQLREAADDPEVYSVLLDIRQARVVKKRQALFTVAGKAVGSWAASKPVHGLCQRHAASACLRDRQRGE